MADAAPSPSAIVLRPAGCEDLGRLGVWLEAAIAAAGPGRLVCDAGRLRPVDAQLVDALARLALIARRRGWTLQLAAASDELVGLIELMGLAVVLLGAEQPD